VPVPGVKLSQVIGRIDIEGKSGSLHYRRVQTELSRAVQVPRETIRSEREIEGDRRIEAQTIGPLPVAVRRERYRMRRYCACKLSEILRAQQRQIAGNRQHAGGAQLAQRALRLPQGLVQPSGSALEAPRRSTPRRFADLSQRCRFAPGSFEQTSDRGDVDHGMNLDTSGVVIGRLEDLDRVLKQGTEPERRAAALALHASRDPVAAALLQRSPDLAQAAANGKLNWQQFATAA
jgi:hypothetical protein